MTSILSSSGTLSVVDVVVVGPGVLPDMPGRGVGVVLGALVVLSLLKGLLALKSSTDRSVVRILTGLAVEGGVVNGLVVLLTPKPANRMDSFEVVKGVSVLLTLFMGMKGFLLGNKRRIELIPLKRLPDRPFCFLGSSCGVESGAGSGVVGAAVGGGVVSAGGRGSMMIRLRVVVSSSTVVGRVLVLWSGKEIFTTSKSLVDPGEGVVTPSGGESRLGDMGKRAWPLVMESLSST